MTRKNSIHPSGVFTGWNGCLKVTFFKLFRSVATPFTFEYYKGADSKLLKSGVRRFSVEYQNVDRSKLCRRGIYLLIGGLVLLLLLSGCTGSGGKGLPFKKRKPPAQEPSEGYGGRALPGASEKVPVVVKRVTPGSLTRYVEVTGVLEGVTDIVMRSQVSGTVINVYKNLGDWIDAGEEIGRIDNVDYEVQLKQAKANVLSAEASFKALELQMQATETLYKEKSVSENEYMTAESNLQKAQAALDGAEAALELAKKDYNNSRFLAPVSGYIADLQLEVGETVTTGAAVCSIVNTKSLMVNTGVGESDIVYLGRGQKVVVRYGDTLERTGKIVGIGIKKSENTANYPVKIELPNPDRLLFPGMIVQCGIATKTWENVLYVSQNNVVKEYDTSYLFVVDDEGRAHRQRVVLGDRIGGDVIISEGLQPGAAVVTDGIENLSEGSAVEIRAVNNNPDVKRPDSTAGVRY